MNDVTRVYLITGFLGSGKTTFLNSIIHSFPPDKKMMILMNEFGEVGVDGTLIEGDDIDMMEISKGSIFCVCVKTDFIKGLNEIAFKTRPHVLLIESTGVANPTDLKRDLNLPLFKGRFEMAEQICLVDAAHFADEYETFSSVEKQISSSTVFVINKIDLATKDQINTVKELIGRHHPDPVIIETTYARIPLETFIPDVQSTGLAGEESEDDYLTGEALEEAIDQILDDPTAEITPPDRLLSGVFYFSGTKLADLESLLPRLPKGIVRAKGFFEADEETYLYSQVMGQREIQPHSLPTGREELLNHLVFIASPEVMADLDDLTADSLVLSKKSVYDPMANQ